MSTEPARISASDVSRVQDLVKSKLRDPGSATFSNISAQNRILSDGKTQTIICGLVNSKNGFGGYAGASAFSVFQDKEGKLSLGAIDESSQLGLALDGHCQTFALL
jgi:hypothetical protein